MRKMQFAACHPERRTVGSKEQNLLWILALAFTIALVACGDDKGSSPNRLPDEVANMYELEDYKCDISTMGAVVYVKSKSKNYECDGDEWFVSYNQKKSSSSIKSSSSAKSSSSKKSSSSSAKSSSSGVSSSSAKSSSSEKLLSSSSSDFVYTPNWSAGKDGEIRNDDSTKVSFKYDEELDKWVVVTDRDTTLMLNGCTTKREGEVVKSSKNDEYYICRKTSWSYATTTEYDCYGVKCTTAEIGKFMTGQVVDTNRYYCSANGWVSLMGGWNWNVPKEARFNPKISYDSMTDFRDGQVYKTVQIGNQVWMAENLNYSDSVRTPSLKGKSRCFDNDSAKCKIIGREYTWAAAIDSVALANDPEKKLNCGFLIECLRAETTLQGICPDGWHLPTKSEIEILYATVGGASIAGSNLKSMSGWRDYEHGKDLYGFTAVPIDGEGSSFGCWSSVGDRVDSRRAYSLCLLNYRKDGVICNGYKSSFGPVRCIKNVEVSSSSSSEIASSSSEKYSSSSKKMDSSSSEKSSSSVVSSSSAVSSSSVASSSSVTMATPCKTETEDNCEYEMLTDERDNKVYKTVKIGDQWWMAENLNYKIDSSFCYMGSSANCEKYGRIYRWATAVGLRERDCGYGNYCSVPSGNVRGVCPKGWHVPRSEEFRTLIKAVGGATVAGMALRSNYDWRDDKNGTDEFGFSALPGGYKLHYNSYDHLHYYAYFWSATGDTYNGDYLYLTYGGAAVVYGHPKYNGHPVRCVKD